MKMKRIIITQTGYEKLTQEKKQLLQERKQAVIDLQSARSLGDLSENAAYKAARWKLSGVDRRLRYLEYVLKTAHISHPQSTGAVDIGSSVQVEIDRKILVFEIVGDHEADPLKSRISYRSPVGKALLGKRVGESVVVNLPTGKSTYQIVGIK